MQSFKDSGKVVVFFAAVVWARHAMRSPGGGSALRFKCNLPKGSGKDVVSFAAFVQLGSSCNLPNSSGKVVVFFTAFVQLGSSRNALPPPVGSALRDEPKTTAAKETSKVKLLLDRKFETRKLSLAQRLLHHSSYKIQFALT